MLPEGVIQPFIEMVGLRSLAPITHTLTELWGRALILEPERCERPADSEAFFPDRVTP